MADVNYSPKMKGKMQSLFLAGLRCVPSYITQPAGASLAQYRRAIFRKILPGNRASLMWTPEPADPASERHQGLGPSYPFQARIKGWWRETWQQ